MVSDFRRFYGLKWPDCIRESGPQYCMDLLDGLECIPGSLYRAYVLDHTDIKVKDSGERRKLGWLDYSQDSRLLLDIRNTLEIIRMFLASMGGSKSEADMVLPPNCVESGKRTVVKADGSDSADGILNTYRSFFVG